MNHVAGDGASPSVLRMILICCNHVLNLTGDFRGPVRGPLYLLKPGVSRGPPGLSGGQAPSGPLVIRPLELTALLVMSSGKWLSDYIAAH